MTKLSIRFGDFAVYTNKKGTTNAVSYSDYAWNLQSTCKQLILKMTTFGLKIHIDLYIRSTYTQLLR